MPRRYVDLTQPLDGNTPPWPGNPGCSPEILDQIPASRGPGQRGQVGESGLCNVSAFRVCNHTGTHMDAPAHFYNGVPTIDRVPLEQCHGPAVVITLPPIARRGEILVEHLQPNDEAVRRCRKVVLNTGWAERWGKPEYFHDYPAISEPAARWLLERQVHLVALDTPSVDREPWGIHFLLLDAQVVIVENLTNLAAIGQQECELAVFPLPLRGLEASPVRAVAIVT